jgi:hypothetical protein
VSGVIFSRRVAVQARADVTASSQGDTTSPVVHTSSTTRKAPAPSSSTDDDDDDNDVRLPLALAPSFDTNAAVAGGNANTQGFPDADAADKSLIVTHDPDYTHTHADVEFGSKDHADLISVMSSVSAITYCGGNGDADDIWNGMGAVMANAISTTYLESHCQQIVEINSDNEDEDEEPYWLDHYDDVHHDDPYRIPIIPSRRRTQSVPYCISDYETRRGEVGQDQDQQGGSERKPTEMDPPAIFRMTATTSTKSVAVNLLPILSSTTNTRNRILHQDSTSINNANASAGAGISISSAIAATPSYSDDGVVKRTVGRRKKQCFDVTVPPGRLGLVIETPKRQDQCDGGEGKGEGDFRVGPPVIKRIEETSILRDALQPGDELVAVDDQDCRRMPQKSVSLLIHKRQHQERRVLTILRAKTY